MGYLMISVFMRGLPVARMSEAKSGNESPACRFAHEGYAGHPTSIVFCAKTHSVPRRDGVPPRPRRLFAAVPRKGAAMIVVAIDIGGTFTDLVGFDAKAGRFVEAKSLTTPRELTQGVLDCIRKSGLDAGAIDELIHGSTIAINTLIERTGAKTGLIVTSGTRDVYIIGRGNRP